MGPSTAWCDVHVKIPGVPHFTVYDAGVAALARVADALEAEGVPYSLAYEGFAQ
jgi:hypothetical protein